MNTWDSAPSQQPGMAQPDRRGVWAVIPAFNEDAVLRTTAAAVAEAGYSVVVVDDGSLQPAELLLRGLDLTIVRHPVNLGQGAALQSGADYALSQGASYIVHFDADGQHPVAGIADLAAPVVKGECDMAIGSRFLRSSDAVQVPAAKRFLLKSGMIVNGLLTGMWLSDAHNGLRVLSRDAASRIRIRENGYAHATEILDLARRARLRVMEVPCTITYTDYSRAKGQSMLNSLNVLIDLLLRRAFR
jgi:glycosyltransferase involved in cell wall biosynthesis